MSGPAVALAVAMLGVLGTLIGVLLRNSKTSPESRTADAQAWNMLNGGLQKEVERQGLKLAANESQITSLQLQVTRLNGVDAVLRKALEYIHTLLDLLNKSGQNPPDPPEGLNLDITKE